MTGALSGFRVLEFGQYIPGPFAAMLLAEQGAEVIKVERPGGDPYRYHPGFMVWNRSKRSITVNLKTDEGRKVAQELAVRSDVLIENLRPGVAESLGIGYETLSRINPRLVYCSISGFGQTGPYRDRPGWDPIVTATAGVYVDQQGEENPPLYLVLPLASYYASLMAAYSTTIALYARETTGKGQRVDVSLLGSLMGAMSIGLVDYPGNVRIPFSDPQGSIPLYKLYQGSDGEWLFLGLGNLTFFTKFAIAMGHEEWLADPLFEGAPFLILPPRNAQVAEMLRKIFSEKTRDEWLDFFQSNDIPCAPAQPVERFLHDPQVVANEMVVEVEQPGLGTVREMGIPVRLSENMGAIQGPSPTPGQHTEEILSRLLGYPPEGISQLRDLGAL